MADAPPPPVDYARFARQVALAEVGAAGQARLANTPVAFRADDARTAAEAAALWFRAGGALTAPDAPVAVDLPPGAPTGVAAWACVEAARRVLGEPPRPMPEGLLERLTPRAPDRP